MVEKMLMDEVECELAKLNKMEAGGDKYKVTVDGITKLTAKYIEIKKLSQQEVENAEKKKCQEIELKLKERQLNNEETDLDLKEQQILAEIKSDNFKNRLSVVTFGISTVVTVAGVVATFVFDEKGTITSTLGRKLIERVLPKK